MSGPCAADAENRGVACANRCKQRPWYEREDPFDYLNDVLTRIPEKLRA
jgi:hypothetical protein